MENVKPDLILVRGLPGSGKSTLAKKLTGYHHVESDMFWGPSYNFDKDRLRDAHKWCLDVTRNILATGYNAVVSNTFTTESELEPYFLLAKELGINLTVVSCHGKYGSIHGVPDDVLDTMRKRFQTDLTSLYEKVFNK